MAGSTSDKFWIKHLLRRAGFGYTPGELEHYNRLGYYGTVDELLHPERVDDRVMETNHKQQGFDFTRLDSLRPWWLYRMTCTRRPLVEKMTLFWHGHFATSDRKVKDTYAMYGQNMLFRAHALGNFQALLYDVSRDPAMIVWLDNQQNRKGRPNENYAREIMELFTLGIGNYSEHDIKEAARAFTGWQTKPGGFFFNANQHDYGAKTVLGTTGDLTGEDVIKILVSQSATAHFLSKKLLRFFAFEDPPPDLVHRIATVYIKSQYNIKTVLEAIFTAPEFMSQKAFHAKIKSPVELAVGSVKSLQLSRLDGDLPTMLERMGQSLFEPPNVKGWDGGPAWIATDTMMERFNFAGRLSKDRFDELARRSSTRDLLRRYGIGTTGQAVDYFLALLVDGDVPSNCRQRLVEYMSSGLGTGQLSQFEDDTVLDTKVRGLVHLIMTLPTYQLA